MGAACANHLTVVVLSCKTEVANLQSPVFVDKDIFRFEVHVHKIVLMHVFYTKKKLLHAVADHVV